MTTMNMARRAKRLGFILLLLLAGALPLQAEVVLQFFNNTWNEITAKIPEIAEAGYGALWLPPPQKASGDLSVGYDLWDPFDLGGNSQRTGGRTRYGTENELLRLIDTAHQFGLRVYFDNIMNHRAFNVPGYDENTPIDLYPGMLPEDFHLQVTEDGFYRAWGDTGNWMDTWEIQNRNLSGLLDIAQETPNCNFGSTEKSSHEKISFVRHPNNPEYYDYHPTLGLVGFYSTNITTNVISQNQSFFKEDVGGYLMRSVRWLMERTKVDGLRLDAVKHVPGYFFGEQWAADKDSSDSGYCGQAQVQFNRSRGFSDANHRDSVFDTEKIRDDAMIFGEHMGEPPPYSDYWAAGMRLLDARAHQTLNDKLGNDVSMSGLQNAYYIEGFQMGESLGVYYAKSHDDNVAYNEHMHNAVNLTRGGLPDIYTDGNRHAETLGQSGGAFPRHANTCYLGQWGDGRIPNLAYLHGQFARGWQYGRYADNDILAYDRVDKRENYSMSDADGAVLCFVLNDNYNAGASRNIETAFPPGSYLYQYASSGGGFYYTVGDNGNGNGRFGTDLIVPPAGYFCFSWRSPEEPDVWSGTDVDPITMYQNDQEVSWMSYERKDGPDGDPGFNPYGVYDANGSDYAYTWWLPCVTSATNLKFVARADASAENIMLKLDGGMDLNGVNHSGGDPRDNPPAWSTDVYLGYEQMWFKHRAREKYAAEDVSGNIIGSPGAASWQVTIGNSGSWQANASSANWNTSDQAPMWVWHNPSATATGSVPQFSTTDAGQEIAVWTKIGRAMQWEKCYIYYTTDGTTWPEGTAGMGANNTKVAELSWVCNSFDNESGVWVTNDWVRGTLPAQTAGTVLRYKIGAYREDSSSIFPSSADNVRNKKRVETMFELSGFNAQTNVYRPHNDFGLYRTGLVDGFHVARARTFLKRDNKAAIYNTFVQPFYLDTETPRGEILYPGENATLGDNRYGAVVRTDPTVTKVFYHIVDTYAANDDGQTGQQFGNGTNGAGAEAWVEAYQVTPSLAIDAVSDYPCEWRFDYNNVAPGNNGAIIYVKLAEITSSTNPLLSESAGHFTLLTRNVQANGPDYILFVGWPQRDGDMVNDSYDMKVYFSGTLWNSDETTVRNRFLILIDGVTQGKEAYDLNWYGGGQYHELVFNLPDMYNDDPNYLHEINVIHTNAGGAGITLYADRYVKAEPSAGIMVQITDPPEYDSDGNKFIITLKDIAAPAPEDRQYQVRVETDLAALSCWITFTNCVGYMTPAAATTNAVTGTVAVVQASNVVWGTGTLFADELSAGQSLRISTNGVVVNAITSNTLLTLTTPYPGATASGLKMYRIDGNPYISGSKKYWTFLWTNIAAGNYTFTANVDTDHNPATVEGSATRNTTVILREKVNSSTNDLDDDDDGVYDTWETNPTNLPTTNPETWNNGDVHYYNFCGKTDPTLPDTDGDRLPDGLEVGFRNAVDISQTDTNMDTNGDGYPNFRGDNDPPFYNTVPDNSGIPNYNFNASRTLQIAGSVTDPNNADTDYDGLPDGIEDRNRNGWVEGDGLAYKPATGNPWTDRPTENDWPDGKWQNWETWTETSPTDADTDDDGASDGTGEDKNADGAIAGDSNSNRAWNAGETWIETDPLDADTDNDGLPDGWEIQYGFDPLDSGVIGVTNLRNQRVTNTLNGASGNPDGDTIVQGTATNAYSNLLEYQNDTNPWIFDSSEPPPEGSIEIGRGQTIGALGDTTYYTEFMDWTADDCLVLDEYEGAGPNNKNGDVYKAWDGWDESRDMMAFYARDGGAAAQGGDDKFYFRIDFYDLKTFAEDGNVDCYVVINFGNTGNGEKNLPDDVNTLTEMGWQIVVAVYKNSQGAVYVDTNPSLNTSTFGQALDASVGVVRRDQNTANGFVDAYFNAQLDAVEFAISRQALLDAGWNGLNGGNFCYQVFTTKDGTCDSPSYNGNTCLTCCGDIGGRTDIRDSIYDDNLAEDYWEAQAGIDSILHSWWTGNNRAGRAKFAMIVHGNQAIQPGSAIQYLINNNAGAGYYRPMASHELFEQQLNFHVTPTLAAAIEWARADAGAGRPWLDGPALNDQIARLARTNLLAFMASAFSDHMMPYFTTAFNRDNVELATSFLQSIYGVSVTTNAVFWTPERLLDGDVLGKIRSMGYAATVMDQMEHLWRWYGRSAALGTRGYQVNRIHGVNCFAINNEACEFMFENTDGGLYLTLRELANRKARSDQDQVVTLFSNWETFGTKTSADAYDLNLRWLANHPWTPLVLLQDILNNRVDLNGDGNGDAWYVEDRGDTAGPKVAHDYLNYATQTNYDNWYLGSGFEEGLEDKIFQARPGVNVTTNYGMTYTPGTVLAEAWSDVQAISDTNLAKLARAVMHASVLETAFHAQTNAADMRKYSTGEYIYPDTSASALAGFATYAQSQSRFAAVYERVDDWAAIASGITTPQTASEDVDRDGEAEYMVYNDRLFALFERIGGRLIGAWVRDIVEGDTYQAAGNLASYPGTATEEEGAWSLNTNGTWAGETVAFRTSCLKDWYATGAGANQYVNQLYTFQDWTNGWRATSGDGAVRKTVTLAEKSWNLEVRYELTGGMAGQTLYIRNGLTPDLYSLLVGGQTYLAAATASGGIVTLANTNYANTVLARVDYAANGHSASYNDTARDDDWGKGITNYTVNMRNQAQTHQVEVSGSGTFTFALGFQAMASDWNNDGMPNTWVDRYGLSTHPNGGASQDADADGVPNENEYVADTNPLDGQSYFHVSRVAASPASGVTVRFPTSAARFYKMWYDNNSLLTPAWSNASPTLIQGTGGTVEWTDNGSTTTPHPNLRTNRYYKVEVRLPE